MKTVFKSDEIAHIWAHESAPRGKSPGNASFEGDAFYSYATVIARRIRHKGKAAYIIDRAQFSTSTSRIQGRVSCAIPNSEKKFSIRSGKRCQSLDWTPQGLRDHFLVEAARVEELPASRYEHKRAEQYREATSLMEKARDVCEFFGLGFLAISRKIDKRNEQNDKAADIIKQASDKREAARLSKDKQEAEAKLLRNIEKAKSFLQDSNPSPQFSFDAEAPAVLALPEELRKAVCKKVESVNAAAFDRWRAGEGIRLPYECPVMLRVERNEGSPIRAEMVTSKGARVYLDDAERTFHFVMKARAKGWHKNGEKHPIGGYQLDAVNEQGVVAGCHRVSWEEIERFAKANGWTT